MKDSYKSDKNSSAVFLDSEDRLRSLLLNELRAEGAMTWNCRFEDCPEKVIIDGIPFRVMVGDIIFKYKGILRLLELKLLRRYCSKGVMRLHFGQTTPAQIKAIADGAGSFVMVAEPVILPRSKCLSCEERLNLLYDLLSENKICYEAVVLNQEEFLKVKKEYIDGLEYISGRRFEEITESYRNISFSKVQTIIPDSFLCFKFREIKKLINKILSKV